MTFFYNPILLVKGCDRLQKAEQLQIGHLTFVAPGIMTHTMIIQKRLERFMLASEPTRRIQN